MKSVRYFLKKLLSLEQGGLPSSEKILSESVRLLLDHFCASRAVIFQIQKGRSLPKAAFEARDPNVQPILGKPFLPTDNSYTKLILTSQTPVVSNNLRADLRLSGQEATQDWGARSMMSAAIVVNGAALGIASLHQCERLRKWSDEEIEQFAAMVDDISTAMELSRPFAEMRKQLSRHSIIGEMGRQFLLVDNLSDLFHTFVTKLRQAYRFDFAVLNLVDEVSGSLNSVEQARYQGDRFVFGNYLPAGYAVPGWCVSNRKWLVIPDFSAETAMSIRREWVEAGMKSCAAFPLVFNDRSLGAALLFRTVKGAFEEQDLRLIQQGVDAVAASVYRIRESVRVMQPEINYLRREDLIRRVSKVIASELEIDVILQQAVNELGRYLGASRCYVVYGNWNEASARKIYEYYAQGVTSLAGSGFPVSANPCVSEALRRQDTVAFADVLNDSSFAHICDYLKQHSIFSTMCRLITVMGEQQVFLFVDQCDRVRTWSDDERELLNTVSQELSLAMEQTQLVARLREQAERELLLNKITTAIRRSLNPEDVLQTTVEELGRTLGIDHCYIGLAESNSAEIVVAAEYCGSNVESILGSSLDGTVFNQESLFETGKFYTIPRSTLEIHEASDFHSHLGTAYVPVRTDRGLIGVIGIRSSDGDRKWLPSEIEFIQAVANQVAVAVSQARLLEQSRKQAERERIITRILQSIAESFDKDEIMAKVVRQLGQALGVSRCFISLYNSDEDEWDGVNFEYTASGVVSMKSSFADLKSALNWLSINRRPLVESSLSKISKCSDTRPEFDLQARMYVPIIFSGGLIGMIGLQQLGEARLWEEPEIDLVTSIAGQLAVALHNAHLFRLVNEGQAQWQHTFDSMADGVALIAPSGRVLRLNYALRRMCAVETGEDLTVATLIDRLKAKFETTGFDPFDEAFKGISVQVEAVCENGQILLFNIDPVLNESTVNGLIFTVRDVSKERQAEMETEQRNRELSALNAISEEITKSLQLDQVIHNAFNKTIELAQADMGVLMVLDEDQESLRPVAYHGKMKEKIMEMLSNVSYRRGVIGAVSEIKDAYAVEDVLEEDTQKDPIFFEIAKQLGLRSALVAKTVSKERNLGVLILSFERKREFPPSDLQLLAGVGRQIGVAIENASLISSLQKALRKLREANRLKDEFLATLSHELRTPLTSIRGWTEILYEREDNDAEMVTGLESILKNSESLEQLINDLLELSRIENRILKLEFEPTEINLVVISAIQTVRQMADTRKVRLLTDLSENLPTIVADSGRLQQVVWNLLSNAIKFSRPDGYVLVKTYEEEGQIVVCVEDNGIGIEPSFLPQVFERFRQADSSSTRNYGGLGIGLSLVKSLVEVHGGTVIAESAGLGHGSKLTVRLPIASELRQSQNSGEMDYCGPNAILLLDDHEDNIRTITSVLKRLGYEVVVSRSIDSALRMLERFVPVMVVMDVNKLGYRVGELLSFFKRKIGAAQVPFVAIAEFPDDEERKHLLDAGFFGVASKPFRRSELFALFNRASELAGAPDTME